MGTMLTVPEAARIARRNPETIRRWIRSGRLATRQFGGRHAIDPADLDEVLHGARAAGLPPSTPHDLREALDWAVRIVREVRDDAR